MASKWMLNMLIISVIITQCFGQEVCFWGRHGVNAFLNGKYIPAGTTHNGKQYWLKPSLVNCESKTLHFYFHLTLNWIIAEQSPTNFSGQYYANCNQNSPNPFLECNNIWQIAGSPDPVVSVIGGTCPIWPCDEISTTLNPPCNGPFDTRVVGKPNIWRSSSTNYVWMFKADMFNWVCLETYPPPCPVTYYAATDLTSIGWVPLSKNTDTMLPFSFPTIDQYRVNCIATPTSNPTIATIPPVRSPTHSPSNNPSNNPSVYPSKSPLNPPSQSPVTLPTVTPTINPSLIPTMIPTFNPSNMPTNNPSTTTLPTMAPITITPTMPPSINPSNIPTNNPTIAFSITSDPTMAPIAVTPTIPPSINPSDIPTRIPTQSPLPQNTKNPSKNPSNIPTNVPTISPTQNPSETGQTKYPTYNPSNTINPSVTPTQNPLKSSQTNHPTYNPSNMPTDNPNISPTQSPLTSVLTSNPTQSPLTSIQTPNPTQSPLTSIQTSNPTQSPLNPSKSPSNIPTLHPTISPSNNPSQPGQTKHPTYNPSNMPTIQPSSNPSKIPTNNPTISPTQNPLQPGQTKNPTYNPSNTPTNNPNVLPTKNPLSSSQTSNPSKAPTKNPLKAGVTYTPTNHPSISPAELPTMTPVTYGPTGSPTNITVLPTKYPSAAPTKCSQDLSLTNEGCTDDRCANSEDPYLDIRLSFSVCRKKPFVGRRYGLWTAAVNCLCFLSKNGNSFDYSNPITRRRLGRGDNKCDLNVLKYNMDVLTIPVSTNCNTTGFEFFFVIEGCGDCVTLTQGLKKIKDMEINDVHNAVKKCTNYYAKQVDTIGFDGVYDVELSITDEFGSQCDITTNGVSNKCYNIFVVIIITLLFVIFI